jgi:hypothetical protein
MKQQTIENMCANKICKQCGNIFYRKDNYRNCHWKTVKYCSDHCRSKADYIKHRDKILKSERERRKRKMIELGKVSNYKLWSKREEDFLIFNYPKDRDICYKNLDRSKSAINNRATLYKLRPNNIRGKNNGMWKGNKVKYEGLHTWIRTHKKKPLLCENCKISKPYDLANISGEYKRDINDFKWLCRRCHMHEDNRIKNLIKGSELISKGFIRRNKQNGRFESGKIMCS